MISSTKEIISRGNFIRGKDFGHLLNVLVIVNVKDFSNV